MNEVKSDFLWIARYEANEPDFPCDLWQYTDNGKVSWDPKGVDLSKLNGDKTLEWFLGTTKDNESSVTV